MSIEGSPGSGAALRALAEGLVDELHRVHDLDAAGGEVQ